MKYTSDKLLLTADFAGTLVFAMEGASAGSRANLDLLGVLVLAFATALGGGIIRDLLIGAAPPQSLRDWRYAVIAFSGGVLVFMLHSLVGTLPGNVIMVLDAAGLSLFAVAGTEKALLYKMPPLIAMLMGTITGVGGGTIRDLLLAQVPSVLHADVYATAALAGSAVMILASRVRASPTAAAVMGGSACFVLRVVSVWQHWNLPRVAN